LSVARRLKQIDRRLILTAVGLALLLLGLLINWRAGRNRGEDFGFLYVLGKSVESGRNVYLLPEKQVAFQQVTGSVPEAGMYYPPSSGIAALPLTYLPYGMAQTLWFWLLTGALIWGMWELMRAFAPDSAPGARMLLLGVVMCSSSVRWGFQLLQSAPLALGLMGLFLAALLRNREAPAFIAGSLVVWLKLTLGLPLLAIALVQRRFRMAFCILALWGLVNGLGFLRMGGMTAVQGYRQNLALLEQPGGHDYADPRQPNALTRLDWPYLLNAIHPNIARSRNLARLLGIAAALWLFLEARRARGRGRDAAATAAFLTPILCLSLLGVYHHHYDASLLLAPLVLICCGPPEMRRLPGVPWIAVVGTLYACLYPIYQVQLFTQRHFGSEALLYLKLIGCMAVTVVFSASLAALHRALRQCPAEVVAEDMAKAA
jgi:hypothetical protein